MNWGRSIILAFVLFAVFIAVLVTVCVRQDVSLVTRDYYQEELVYEEQLARMRNAAGLSEPPSFKVSGADSLEVVFSGFSGVEHGELYLFCPSNAGRDKRYTLRRVDSTVQRFGIAAVPHGMYKARMTWTMGGKDFFVERLITI